jgi:hypothetical protein
MKTEEEYKRKNSITGWIYHIWLVIISMLYNPHKLNQKQNDVKKDRRIS